MRLGSFYPRWERVRQALTMTPFGGRSRHSLKNWEARSAHRIRFLVRSFFPAKTPFQSNLTHIDVGKAMDQKIKELGDWLGKTLAKVRTLIHQADPEIVEEWKWVKGTSPGTPVFFHGGIVCTGETYKSVVKLTFARGAALKAPSRLFNSSFDGNVRRAIDIHEGDKIDEPALNDLIRPAVTLNLKGKSKPRPRRGSSKRRRLEPSH